MSSQPLVKLVHPNLGLCELVRIEATDWIVRVESTGVQYRVRTERRSQFTVCETAPEIQYELQLTAPEPSSTNHENRTPPRCVTDRAESSPQASSANGFITRRHARRTIESLRVGLPSFDGSTRQLAVGFGEMKRLVADFLRNVDEEGGAAMIVRGAYGQGKTFSLTMLEEVAHESGFITIRTEVDATENRLSMPHHVYRDLMKHLRIPGQSESGIRHLAAKAIEFVNREGWGRQDQRENWLQQRLECAPLAWLLSDPMFLQKPALVGLLEGDPNYPVKRARLSHCRPPAPRRWPAFSAGTQGDFASYLMSGLGRLARMLGYKGLVVIMDEMEKWNLLNWVEQSRAGNLLGGLIWGATAKLGSRDKHDNPRVLSHSYRCGGYPFTTLSRCHLGVVIAMTPREHDDPERIWAQYGPIDVGILPSLTEFRLAEYCKLVVPFVARAYSLDHPNDKMLEQISLQAIEMWRLSGQMTTRSGVQSVIAAFDNWRDEQVGAENEENV